MPMMTMLIPVSVLIKCSYQLVLAFSRILVKSLPKTPCGKTAITTFVTGQNSASSEAQSKHTKRLSVHCLGWHVGSPLICFSVLTWSPFGSEKGDRREVQIGQAEPGSSNVAESTCSELSLPMSLNACTFYFGCWFSTIRAIIIPPFK